MPRAHAPKKPTPAPRALVDDLRGAARLAAEAASGITDVVEAMHLAIGAGPAVLGRPLEVPLRRITRPFYGTIRGGMQLVGTAVEAALARVGLVLGPRLGEAALLPEREAALAVLGGVLGDNLEQTGNPLAIEMRLRSGGRALDLEAEALRSAFPRASRRLLVLVHGSCVTDRQWRREGHDHGAALARDLGFTPVYLHYNTGLHASVNGRRFAALLEELASAWPVPLDELVILAHSMGGLVARSACHLGEVAGHRWRRKLRGLVCIGTPHHGAPLERGGHWIDVLLGVSRYSAPLARLGRIRSAGVTDMRYGNVLDEDWQGRDRFAHGKDARTRLALPAGVACYAIAATTAPRGTKTKPPGDGLVPVESALGRHARPELTLEFPAANRWIARATNHVQLLSRPEVYRRLRSWLAP